MASDSEVVKPEGARPKRSEASVVEPASVRLPPMGCKSSHGVLGALHDGAVRTVRRSDVGSVLQAGVCAASWQQMPSIILGLPRVAFACRTVRRLGDGSVLAVGAVTANWQQMSCMTCGHSRTDCCTAAAPQSTGTAIVRLGCTSWRLCKKVRGQRRRGPPPSIPARRPGENGRAYDQAARIWRTCGQVDGRS